jgi:hypothetical protein
LKSVRVGGGAERVCGVWVHRLDVLAKRCLRRVASEGVRAHACACAETESRRRGELEYEPKPERVGERVGGPARLSRVGGVGWTGVN